MKKKEKNAHNITTFYVTLILHYTYIVKKKDAYANNVKNTKFFTLFAYASFFLTIYV
jgi:hypothetical protein